MKNTVILITLAIVMVVSIGTVMSSSEPWERDEERQPEEARSADAYANEAERVPTEWPGPRADVTPVQDAAYKNECGACHFAYQPGLLPGSAWARILGTLADHYGEDASLDATQLTGIHRYLMANAADHSALSRSRAFAFLPGVGDALPRVTTTAYFRREHHEIPTRFVQGNTGVGSFSNCQACHRNADAGIYNEHQVVIPGVGQWDD